MTATTDISVNESNEPSVLLPSSENNESASKPKKRGRKSKAELEELSRKFNRLTEDKNGNETSANGESQNKTKSGSSGPDPTTTIKKKRGRPKLKEGTQSPKTASEGNSAPVVEDSGDQTFSSVQNPLPHRRRGRPKANSLIPAIPVATSSENVRRRGRPKANLDQSEDLPSIKKRGRKRSAPVLTSQNNTKRRGRPPKRLDLTDSKPPVELVSEISFSNLPPTPTPERFVFNEGGTTLDMVVTGLQDIAESVKSIQTQVNQILTFAEQYMGPNGHRR